MPETLTLDEKIAAIKKILALIISDYERANRKMGRKSWKSIADGFYTEAKSLENLLNDKGFLYGLLCEKEKLKEKL